MMRLGRWGGGGGALNKVLYGEALHRPNPYSHVSYIPFLMEELEVPISYIRSLEDCTPFIYVRSDFY